MKRARSILKVFLAVLATVNLSLILSGLYLGREWAGVGLVLLMTTLVIAATTLNSPVFSAAEQSSSQGVQDQQKVA